MNKFVLFVAMLLSVTTAFCQPKITAGTPYKQVETFRAFYFNQLNEILAVKVDSKNKVTIQKMDAGTLAVKSTQQYGDILNASIERVVAMKGRYYLFYWTFKQEQLFVREIDFASGAFAGAARVVVNAGGGVADILIKPGFEWLDNYNKYLFSLSADSSTLAVQYRLAKGDKAGNDRINLYVFDHTLTEKWHGGITLPYPEKRLEVVSYYPTTAGQVYAVARVFDDLKARDKNKDDDAHYKLEVFKLPMGAGAATTVGINASGKFLKSLKLTEGPTGTLTGAGFYTNKDAMDPADGMVTFTLDGNGKAGNLKTYDIPANIRTMYGGDSPEEEMKRMRMQDIIVQTDGGLLLVGEDIFLEIRTSSSLPVAFQYFNDILLTRIDANGNVSWMHKIPKYQMGSGVSEGLSYRYKRWGDKHYLLYIDNVNNQTLPTTKAPARHGEGVGGFLVTFQVNDKTGEVTKSLVFDTRNILGGQVLTFKPHTMLIPTPGELIFEAPRKKEDVLLRVVLPK